MAEGFGGGAGGGGFGGGKSKSSSFPDLTSDAEKCEQFLRSFRASMQADAPAVYLQQLQDIADQKSDTLTISVDHINAFGDNEFLASVLHNTARYVTLFYRAADKLMPSASAGSAAAQGVAGAAAGTSSLSYEEVFRAHRVERQRRAQAEQASAAVAVGGAEDAARDSAADMFPPELLRRYEIRITPAEADKPTQLRQIKSDRVGSYVCVRGIVTRVTDVAPQVRVVTYICATCGFESYQPVGAREFTPLKACPSPACTANQSEGQLLLQTRGSKFVRFQTVRLQELHTEVPVGHIPRSTTLRVYGGLTRTMKPGDLVTVAGIFLVAPYAGFRAVRAGLTADTYIEAMHVQAAKKSYAAAQAEQDALTAQRVKEASKQTDIYAQLAASIAPEIFGHGDIKKALMLLLVGGVTRKLSDGLKIRGDINVLLMGDPGVAKSQLLKHIAHVAPRGIYTTGKGSSGVGLTAAVLRDPTTGDMSLEGGSLVLADMGICCIDEFDKMEEGDRTAIHEVMEQQTVSIAKAGITTTLNARAAVLAAANPVWGRWRPKASPEANLGLPASLLSRFDLTWIILDKPDVELDQALARHVTHVHRESTAPKAEGAAAPFEPSFIRAYVAAARAHTPFVPAELSEYIVSSYVALRKAGDNDAVDGAHYGVGGGQANTRQSFCTARQLLSILRLAQALARLHFRDSVERDDVEEAMRLVEASRESHKDESDRRERVDPVSAIYALIQQMARDNGGSHRVSRQQALERSMKKGYSQEEFVQTLEQYEQMGVLAFNERDIRFTVEA